MAISTTPWTAILNRCPQTNTQDPVVITPSRGLVYHGSNFDDALLIAAAPDLLAACQMLLSAVGPLTVLTFGELEAARAAIAKALGK